MIPGASAHDQVPYGGVGCDWVDTTPVPGLTYSTRCYVCSSVSYTEDGESHIHCYFGSKNYFDVGCTFYYGQPSCL